jgi:hypothetical protein
MREDFEVLSAVLDGDVVDIAGLETALENPQGRRVFVDFVRLRQTAGNDIATPRREFYEGVVRDMTVNEPVRRRGLPFPLAAAAVLVAMLFGSMLDLNFIRRDPGPVVPPEPTRVLRFEPGVDWQPQTEKPR